MVFQFDSKWSHIADAERQSLRLENPLETGVVTTHDAEEAYQKSASTGRC